MKHGDRVRLVVQLPAFPAGTEGTIDTLSGDVLGIGPEDQLVRVRFDGLEHRRLPDLVPLNCLERISVVELLGDRFRQTGVEPGHEGLPRTDTQA